MTSATHGAWLGTLRRYLWMSLVGHFLWEVVQTPLYSIFWSAPIEQTTFAIVHCTGGDMLIATSSIVIALLFFADDGWPVERSTFVRVSAAAIFLGFVYTIFSEWLNTTVRHSWSYTPAMPVIPGLEVGLTPLLQWIVVPTIAFMVAARALPRPFDDARKEVARHWRV